MKKFKCKITYGFILIFLTVFLSLIINNKLSNKVFKNSNKKIPIYSVDRKDKKISITFDVNWGEDNTDEILEILDKHNVKCTFFVIGKWAEENKDIVSKIYNKGHEIGNHSYSHKDFNKISEMEMKREIYKCDEVIKNIIGKVPDLFRFPSGSYNNNSVMLAECTNHYCIQWDVDSIDWKQQGENIEYNRIMKNVKDGSIMLFHTNAKYTPYTLNRIINDLKKEGYKFTFVGDLIYREDYSVDFGGKQIKE